MRAHITRNSNESLRGDRTRCEEKFYRVDHVDPLPGQHFLVTRMLTRDLFSVANLVWFAFINIALLLTEL